MQFKDYYSILGVEPSAGEAEIKTAYRRLARKYHPDVSKEAGAEERFKAINEAYEALRDPAKRKAYDQLRTRGYRPGDEVQPPPGGFGQGGHGGNGGFDFEEVFADGGAGGGFSDFFESLFRRQQAGRGPSGPGYAQRPRGDTRAKLAVSLEAVYRGDTVRIGIGGRTLDVRIPRGVRPGQVIRLGGQGEQGGNLLLEIEYAAHPKFEVDGRNIIYSLPVAPWEAALGATVEVPTLGGVVELKVPADSEAGR
jgi:curved DNA-binding protein